MSVGKSSRYALGPLFAAALFFCVAAPIFWLRVEVRPGGIGEAYENSELYQYVYPILHYGFGRLRDGELPLWNPRQLCGTPFLADPRTGVFQPLNGVFLGWPTEQALRLHAFLSLFLMGVGMVLFARSLGLGYVPGFVGGVAYAFCGASAAAMSRPVLAGALAWAPFVFWGIREYGRGFRWPAATLAGLFMAMVLLSGANAVALVLFCLAMTYLVFLTVFPGRVSSVGWGRRTAGIILFAVVALAVASIQWAPTVAWMASLDRPAEALWGLAPTGQGLSSARDLLVQFLGARTGNVPHIGYMGIVPLILIPVALLHRDRSRDARFFFLMGLAFWFLATLPPKQLPWMFPREVFAFPGAYCIAVLAALGADRILAADRTPHVGGIRLTLLLVGVFSLVLFLISTSIARTVIILFVMLLFPIAVFRRGWSSAISGVAIALLLFVELIVANTNAYLHPSQNAPACYMQHATAIGQAEEQAHLARVLVSGRELSVALPANLGMIASVDVAGGRYLPLSKDQARWWRNLSGGSDETPAEDGVVAPEAARPELLNYMAVRVLLAEPNSAVTADTWAGRGPRFRVRSGPGDLELSVNEDALPRAYWVPRVCEAEGVAGALERLARPDFNPNQECVAEPAADTRLAAKSDTAFTRNDASCTLRDVSPERIVIGVDAPEQGVTVLADSFAPGWTASVDGVPCAILRTNGIFRGVATPAGLHEIVFEYHPLSFRIGLVCCVASLVALVIAGGYALVRGG